MLRAVLIVVIVMVGMMIPAETRATIAAADQFRFTSPPPINSLKTERHTEPSSSPSPDDAAIAKVRKRVADTSWRFKSIRVTLHDNGTAGYFFTGGKWRIVATDKINVYDKFGTHRITLKLNADLRTGRVTWKDGTKHDARRIK